MLENTVVDDRDIENGESKHEAGHDTPEQEPVAPDIEHPLGEVALRLGLHAEETASKVDHLPGEEEGKPGHAGECCCSGAEYCIARVVGRRIVILSVATHGKVAIAPAEHDESEGGKTESGHPNTIDEGINNDFPGKDTLFL